MMRKNENPHIISYQFIDTVICVWMCENENGIYCVCFENGYKFNLKLFSPIQNLFIKSIKICWRYQCQCQKSQQKNFLQIHTHTHTVKMDIHISKIWFHFYIQRGKICPISILAHSYTFIWTLLKKIICTLNVTFYSKI